MCLYQPISLYTGASSGQDQVFDPIDLLLESLKIKTQAILLEKKAHVDLRAMGVTLHVTQRSEINASH